MTPVSLSPPCQFSHLVDEHASVGAQASESEADMVVDLANLPYRPRVLQLGRRLALDPEADDVLAPHANLSEKATVSGGARLRA
jgi:hypothetical protein